MSGHLKLAKATFCGGFPIRDVQARDQSRHLALHLKCPYRDVQPALLADLLRPDGCLRGIASAILDGRLVPDGPSALLVRPSKFEVLDEAADSGDEDAPAVAESLGMLDEALEGVEYRESLKPLLERLPPREKRILMLRFFGNMTQSQIATELGISQMHVSRLLARTLTQLREGLTTDE